MIERVQVHLHSLALELAGRTEPSTGLEGKLSVSHAAAVALLYGKAGVLEFTDDCVQRGEVLALRRKIGATPEPSLGMAGSDAASSSISAAHSPARTSARNGPRPYATTAPPGARTEEAQIQ